MPLPGYFMHHRFGAAMRARELAGQLENQGVSGRERCNITLRGGVVTKLFCLCQLFRVMQVTLCARQGFGGLRLHNSTPSVRTLCVRIVGRPRKSWSSTKRFTSVSKGASAVKIAFHKSFRSVVLSSPGFASTKKSKSESGLKSPRAREPYRISRAILPPPAARRASRKA